jgi:dTDP-4-amino-4,6-dideoxygalactose transaminase
MIPVTKTFLPPIEEYTAQVQRAYNNHWLTNRGELVKELEAKLMTYLGVNNVLIMNNGHHSAPNRAEIIGQRGRSHHHTF